MTQEELEEKQELQMQRDLFAGIALPGLISTAGHLTTHRDIAKKAYDIAAAMMFRRKEIIEQEQEEDESNS